MTPDMSDFDVLVFFFKNRLSNELGNNIAKKRASAGPLVH